ncbi:MAG: Fic family protein [Deltaproteobacteria bacterium]|nr:Fic family protein [Deltaproteobacteria bacterium]
MEGPETHYRIEPCLLEAYLPQVADLVADIVSTAGSLGNRLHPLTAANLADMVRVMNCYYSNLIEGHNTRPRDIERAMNDDLDDVEDRRSLQLEARAHIRVQAQIDDLHKRGELPNPASQEFLRWVHRAFYEDAPSYVLQVSGPQGNFQMIPGEFRHEPREDNVVGQHRPPSSPMVAGFMQYFEKRYPFSTMGSSEKIVAMATSHHRFNYIHPFADGNGRVSRLMSHAMTLQAGIGAHGLWSISRGLARGLSDRGEYKRMMDLADTPRQGDLDGRGNLSQKALDEFVTWFLSVALDQLQFMSRLFDLENLSVRLIEYVTRELRLQEHCVLFVQEVFRRGEVPRGEASRIMGRPDRTARDMLRKLVESGLIASRTPKGPVHLRFSTFSAEALFPRLFPPA